MNIIYTYNSGYVVNGCPDGTSQELSDLCSAANKTESRGEWRILADLKSSRTTGVKTFVKSFFKSQMKYSLR